MAIAPQYSLRMPANYHIEYVTGRELKLMNKAGAAYSALLSAFQGDETQLDAVESYSAAVFVVRLSFQSLK